jgi:hypothetical protein
VRIVNIADADGRLIRRVRRDRDGREIIIIDNSYGGPRASTMFIELPPPVIRIPRDHYNGGQTDDLYLCAPIGVFVEITRRVTQWAADPIAERNRWRETIWQKVKDCEAAKPFVQRAALGVT